MWTSMVSVYDKRPPPNSTKQWQKAIPLLVLSQTQEGLPFSLIFSLPGTDFTWFHRMESWNLVTNTLRFSFLAFYYTNIFNSNTRVCCIRLWENRCFREIYYVLLILSNWGTSLSYFRKIYFFDTIMSSISPFYSFFKPSHIYLLVLFWIHGLFSHISLLHTYVCMHKYFFPKHINTLAWSV